MIAEALVCIALNVYYETAPMAKEPMEGKLAVAFVPLTRARNNGTSICWEIFRDSQFSWTNDTMKLRTLPKASDPKWKESQDIALAVLNGATDFTRGATHYHHTSIKPRWAKDPKIARVGVWGSHIFYRQEKQQ